MKCFSDSWTTAYIPGHVDYMEARYVEVGIGRRELLTPHMQFQGVIVL